ncbi:hypothetical protein DPV78_010837 [Talaromyces pinophilus]|nr:hypothetical protein DPV78_010837 [Talaromyces pinophilus]
MEGIIDRLQKREPVIARIFEISGTPEPLGVLHENEVVCTTEFAYRDVAKQLPADGNTLYHIASLTKSSTGTAINILVNSGELNLDDPN